MGKFRSKGKWYAYSDMCTDFVVKNYETLDNQMSLTDNNYNWKKHRNDSKSIGKTFTFAGVN